MMDTKKLILAIVVAYIILLVTGYLIHEVWLINTYRQMRVNGASLRPEDVLRQKLWILWLGDLLFAVLFAWIYTRGVEDKPWVGQGIRYGIIMTLFAVVPSTLSIYVAWNLSYKLALKWMVAGGIQLILIGLFVAGIYKRSLA